MIMTVLKVALITLKIPEKIKLYLQVGRPRLTKMSGYSVLVMTITKVSVIEQLVQQIMDTGLVMT